MCYHHDLVIIFLIVIIIIMMGRSNGRLDEYLTVGYFQKTDGRRDGNGRPWGRLGTTFRGEILVMRFWQGF